MRLWTDLVFFPDIKLELDTFDMLKETPKGYWIGYGSFDDDNTLSWKKWVSKTSVKRFAYPTKEEALVNFTKRTEKWLKMLKHNTLKCTIALTQANVEKNNLKKGR